MKNLDRLSLGSILKPFWLIPILLNGLFLGVLNAQVGRQGQEASQPLQIRFEGIGLEQGLPHKSVSALCQDSLGFIWMGTWTDLVKYDGCGFSTYRYQIDSDSSENEGLHPIRITRILEIPGGDLLVGCNHEGSDLPRLYRFHRKTEQLQPLFTELDTILQARIWDIKLLGGYLWIYSGKLFRVKATQLDNKQSIPIEHLEDAFEGDTNYQDGDFIGFIDQDEEGRVWVPTTAGLYQWISSLDTFQFNRIPEAILAKTQFEQLPWLFNIEEDGKGNLLLFSPLGGFYFTYAPTTKQWAYVAAPEYKFYFHKIRSKSRKVWMGGYQGNGGLQIFDPHKQNLSPTEPKVDGLRFLPQVRIRSMLEDHSGIIWMGLLGGPLLKHDPLKGAFHWRHFQPNDPQGLKHDYVTGIQQDKAGTYWISTYGGGLHQWDKESGHFTQVSLTFSEQERAKTGHLSALTISSSGEIWFGAGWYVGRFDPKTKHAQYYYDPGVIMTVYEDRDKNFWLAKNGGGLSKFYPEIQAFQEIGIPNPYNKGKDLRLPMGGIMQDSRGVLWIGSYAPEFSGFFHFDPKTEKYEVFKLPEAHHFYEDGAGYVWIGSQDGLYSYNLDSATIRRYGLEEGLVNLSIGAITEDQSGRLWMATDNGIASLDPQREVFHHYTPSQGLANYHFKACVYQNEAGEIFFGGEQGILYFHPDSIKENSVPPKLAFTGFDLQNAPLKVEAGSPLQVHPSFTRRLSLAHDENDLTIHYTALHYQQPAKNKYQVILEPKDKEWRDVGNLRSATYTNLKPGQYRFKVKAANSDGIWNPDPITLDISIAPPWYWNIYSQLFYMLAALLLLFVLYRFQLNRRLAEAEAYRLSELDRVKTQLYTNITHEFRTPLTVILGMADQAMQDPSKWFRQGLSLIKRNGERLLVLVNQLLDLDKIKAGKLVFEPVQDDIVAYLKQLMELFGDFAEAKKIQLHFRSEIPHLDMDFDPEKLHTIISNLIGNALKFTGEEGEVYLKVKQHKPENAPAYCQIRVVDNGTGIPDGEQALVFDRFYQVDGSATREQEGTGIGLTLVKELVELSGGSIRLESTAGMGTTFILELPIYQNATRSKATVASPAVSISPIDVSTPEVIVSEEEAQEERRQVLLVEDNVDILQYLKSCLVDSYTITIATDGLQGQSIAIEQIPDLIISDIMMPGMNGIELLQELKNDERTSHIPIILLTAKADISFKLEGLAHGADAYLVKPFHQAELEIRIRKLIDLRKELQQYYNNGSLQQQDLPANLAQEDRFLQRVKGIVHHKIEEEGFGVMELCEALSLSRSQLHRKLNALTGKSASKVIRGIKMAKAKELLLNSNKNVAEVGYAVGYGNRSHFTQAFNAEFGKPPSYFRP